MWKKILLKLFCFTIVEVSMTHKCQEKTLFSSKTPYKMIFNESMSKVTLPAKTCKAIHINMVHRHGHRYPSAKDINSLRRLESILNSLTHVPDGVNLTLPWISPFHLKEDKILTSVGEGELYNIGIRIRTRFPNIFSEGYTPFTFKFQSTCKLRCTHSAISIAAGLFQGLGSLGKEKYQPIALETFPCHRDFVLRFFDHCDKYLKEVETNSNARKEMEKFMNGPQVENVINRIKQKLDDPELPLEAKDIKALFLQCAYEIGMFNGSIVTGMCSLFDDEDIQVMEYTHDQKNFYLRSLAHKINYDSSCPLLADMVATIKVAVEDPEAPLYGVFRSAHAETIVPLFTRLGLFADTPPLSADNFEKMKSREFRMGCYAPFSGNMYFVVFECDGRHKIQLYVNERLTRIECCESEVDCDLDVFFKCYDSIVKNCNLKSMCKQRSIEL